MNIKYDLVEHHHVLRSVSGFCPVFRLIFIKYYYYFLCFLFRFLPTGPDRGAGRGPDRHTVCAGVQHVLLRGLRAGRTRAVRAQRGLLLPIRARIRGAGAQTGRQVAENGAGRGFDRVQRAHGHQEQRLAGR